MELIEIAKQIREAKESIFLIYAFNGTGKTRLSIQYKEDAREQEPDENGKRKQTGVYYNAYSEDLFVWDNDIDCYSTVETFNNNRGNATATSFYKKVYA